MKFYSLIGTRNPYQSPDDFMDSMNTRKILSTSLVFGLLPLSVLLFAGSAWVPDFIEHVYARCLYPAMASPLSRVTGVLPFSLAEFFIYGAALLFFFRIVRAVVRMARRRVKIRTQLGRFVRHAFLVLGIIYFLFIFLWGCNNNRWTLERIEGYETGSVTVSELERCITEMNRGAALEVPAVMRDAGGIMLRGNRKDLICVVEDSFGTCSFLSPLLEGTYGRPKEYFFSTILSRMGTAGFYFPFTGEVTLNGDIPAVTRPFVMAHEMAHQRGFARENEANFIAYRVCAASASAELRYSARVTAIMYLLGNLKREDTARYEAILKRLDRRVLAEIDNNRKFWQSRQGRARKIFSAWNDLFLRASNQKEGRKSYGRFTDLLVAAMRSGQL